MTREQEIKMIKDWIRQGLSLEQMASKLELPKNKMEILLESYEIDICKIKDEERLWWWQKK